MPDERHEKSRVGIFLVLASVYGGVIYAAFPPPKPPPPNGGSDEPVPNSPNGQEERDLLRARQNFNDQLNDITGD